MKDDNSVLGIIGLGLALAAFGALWWYDHEDEKRDRAAVTSHSDSSDFIYGVQEQQFMQSLERAAADNHDDDR